MAYGIPERDSPPVVSGSSPAFETPRGRGSIRDSAPGKQGRTVRKVTPKFPHSGQGTLEKEPVFQLLEVDEGRGRARTITTMPATSEGTASEGTTSEGTTSEGTTSEGTSTCSDTRKKSYAEAVASSAFTGEELTKKTVHMMKSRRELDKTESDKNAKAVDFLWKGINKLSDRPKNDKRMKQFLTDSEGSALILIESISSNPLSPNCDDYYKVLLSFASTLAQYDFSEDAAKWYQKIYDRLFDWLNDKQKNDFESQFKIFVDQKIQESFHRKFVDVKAKIIPETHQLLLRIFKKSELFNLLDLDRQAEMIAIACQVVICRNKNSDAYPLLNHWEYQDLRRNCEHFFQDKNPAWWVAWFLWIAASALTEDMSAEDAKRIIGMVEDAEKEVCELSPELWTHSFKLPQSYYRMRVECLPVYFKLRLPNHEQILRQLLDEIRIEYPKICKSKERVKAMIAHVLLSLGNFLVVYGEIEQMTSVIQELKVLGIALGKHIQVDTSMLEAEMDMVSYKCCQENINKKSSAESITKLQELKKRLYQHIQIINVFKEQHYKSSLDYCLGRLHYALEEWSEADENFKQYKGRTILCYRLHGITLKNLGRYKEASELFQSLEKKNTLVQNKIYLEHAINLFCWIKSSQPAPDDIVEKALDKYMQAIQAGEDDWPSGWNGVGHFFDMLNNKKQLNFSSFKNRLIPPISQCSGWEQASAIAFTIANSDTPEQTRKDIISVGPSKYREQLIK